MSCDSARTRSTQDTRPKAREASNAQSVNLLDDSTTDTDTAFSPPPLPSTRPKRSTRMRAASADEDSDEEELIVGNKPYAERKALADGATADAELDDDQPLTQTDMDANTATHTRRRSRASHRKRQRGTESEDPTTAFTSNVESESDAIGSQSESESQGGLSSREQEKKYEPQMQSKERTTRQRKADLLELKKEAYHILHVPSAAKEYGLRKQVQRYQLPWPWNEQHETAFFRKLLASQRAGHPCKRTYTDCPHVLLLGRNMLLIYTHSLALCASLHVACLLCAQSWWSLVLSWTIVRTMSGSIRCSTICSACCTEVRSWTRLPIRILTSCSLASWPCRTRST